MTLLPLSVSLVLGIHIDERLGRRTSPADPEHCYRCKFGSIRVQPPRLRQDYMRYSTTSQSDPFSLANGTYQIITITSPATPSIMPIPRISPGLPENILAPPPNVETEEEIATAENRPTITERNHLDCEVLKRAMALYMVYGIHSNEMMIINCGVIVMRCGVCGVIG